jgi:hypothetical protein
MHLYFRQSDNVLKARNWGILKVSFLKDCTQIRSYKSEVVYWGDSILSIPVGQRLSYYDNWLKKDYTGNHPEQYNEVWDSVAAEWVSSNVTLTHLLQEQVVGRVVVPYLATS